MQSIKNKCQYRAAQERYFSLLGQFLDIDSQEFYDFHVLRALICEYENKLSNELSTARQAGRVSKKLSRYGKCLLKLFEGKTFGKIELSREEILVRFGITPSYKRDFSKIKKRVLDNAIASLERHGWIINMELFGETSRIERICLTYAFDASMRRITSPNG